MITSINNENNLNFGRHCGEKTGQSVLVTGEYAVLTFHADEIEETRGFLLYFSAIPEGKLNQKTDRLFRRKELPRKENPGGEQDGRAWSFFSGLKNVIMFRDLVLSNPWESNEENTTQRWNETESRK